MNVLISSSLVVLLVLSLVTPALLVFAPPPTIHASFKSLPHDFVPRRNPEGGLQPFPLPAPTGLASYGSKGNLSTDAVKGSATFDSLNLGVDVIPPPYASNYTFIGTGYGSLQLNAVLWVPGHGVYWTQNVIFIASNTTMEPQVELVNNIWNFSSPTAVLHPQYIRGNGTVSQPVGYYYYVDPVVYNLTFPFTVNLSMGVSSVGAGGVRVSFGYSIASGNGSVYTGVYDSVVLFPTVSGARAYYQIGSYAPNGLPSDVEYVLGGPGGGSFAVVEGISGLISLYYHRDGLFVSVPDAYSYGSDTGETVYFVTVGRDLGDPSAPQGVLSFGNLNSYELWPVTPVLEAFTAVGVSQLTVSGYLFYQAGTGSSFVPLSGQRLTLSLQGLGDASNSMFGNVSVVTSASGSFSATIPVGGVGADQLVVWYNGGVAFNPTYSVTQLEVYPVSLKGVGSYTVGLNGVGVNLSVGTHYIVAPRGAQVTLTVANQTGLGAYQRVLASVFVNGVEVHNETVSLPTSALDVNVTIVGTVQYLVDVVQRTSTGVLNQSFWYDSGSPITLSAQRYIYTNSTSRYAFQGWSVNGELVNSTSLALNVSTPLIVDGVYVEQDLITLSSPLSNVSVWGAVGEPYSLSAPASYGGFPVSYHFKQWSGSLGGSANTLTFVVSRPVSVVAVYSASYTGVIALPIAVFLAGLGVGLLLRRRAKMSPI
ncbi:hypothetical protein B9Q06_05800 [Candidatus Marsarchaeota G2 archaeon ECH_B_2]|uniref:Bacterial repeat domain-containing protein n=3 Tax=Candidatus Marsarchaeota group 2 TaxID=2203771 RepID=A0A2R6B9V8_9ARCH|nr:MAG: hypothetical protein B9Q06_05800 [Candidatus Marsarchaeota G2 archaeon ECH_B_2]PSN98300.1 MAG: hypothetical protein B9Q07_10160 [Candidatus Marsarchaeota G2 archaeon ECH_B_3]PSO00004.1 MAG: hypothetical protein B9Q05_11010 [Candidatus Marsarchaeota G2 archaeon ECH_B_1]